MFDTLYGKEPEIWPPTNEDTVSLTDSFPGGIVPDTVMNTLRDVGEKEHPRRRVTRILRLAATEDQASATRSARNNKSLILAISLLSTGLVRPLDILIVAFLSGYTTLLSFAAKSVRRDGQTPSLPALPPQGHVPALVANPLGYDITYSRIYDLWLQAGLLLGVVGPLAVLGHAKMVHKTLSLTHCVRPLFILACQVFTENVTRRTTSPLPIRILVPVAYNTVRLGYLWQWMAVATCWEGTLAVANFGYWSLNLFGFLLPVATMRYMRAHFFGVEAAQVSLRPGLEESVGLSSHNSLD